MKTDPQSWCQQTDNTFSSFPIALSEEITWYDCMKLLIIIEKQVVTEKNNYHEFYKRFFLIKRKDQNS